MVMHEVEVTGKRTGSKVSKPLTKKWQLLKLQKISISKVSALV
jgi:hypothetical protein